jgi:hypothetical protein
MPFEFVCPNCHCKTKVLDKYAGQTGPCVGCGKTVTMPHYNEKGVLVPSIQTIQNADSKAPSKPRSWMPAIVGAASVFSILLTGAVILWISWPSIKNSVRRVAQNRDFDNMQIIATALNAYADRYGTYPPPIVTDAAGKKLYSWRVLILPFMGHEPLYKSFELSQAWDSATNANLIRQMPSEFGSPNSINALSTFETNYVLITGPGTLFPPTGPMGYKGIDPETLLLVETNNSTTWSEPGDIDISRGLKVGNRSMLEMGGLHQGTFTAVTADRVSLRLPSDISPTMLNALVTPNGGEKVVTTTFQD